MSNPLKIKTDSPEPSRTTSCRAIGWASGDAARACLGIQARAALELWALGRRELTLPVVREGQRAFLPRPPFRLLIAQSPTAQGWKAARKRTESRQAESVFDWVFPAGGAVDATGSDSNGEHFRHRAGGVPGKDRRPQRNQNYELFSTNETRSSSPKR